MSAELRISAYLIFVISLFFCPDLTYYSASCLILAAALAALPFRTLKAGWIPISVFLVFTFFSNAFHQAGRVVFISGPVLLTEEGLRLASIRTLRILLMIGGVKLLMGTTKSDAVIAALARLLSPFERLGLPIKDFFHVMGLTLTCFPVLQDTITERYRNLSGKGVQPGLWGRARLIASFLVPLFVETIQSPEVFFRKKEPHEETV